MVSTLVLGLIHVCALPDEKATPLCGSVRGASKTGDGNDNYSRRKTRKILINILDSVKW